MSYFYNKYVQDHPAAFSCFSAWTTWNQTDEAFEK